MDGDSKPTSTSNQEQGHNAILAMIKDGQVLQAQRSLDLLQATEDSKSFNSEALERLHRVAACYKDTLGELEVQGQGWTTEKVDDLEYSYRFAGGELQLVSTIESNADPVKAMAAILEVDLCTGYKSNVIRGNCLGGDPCDAVWQVIQKGKFSGALEDNISYLSVVDSLNEDLGSLWACVYPPKPDDPGRPPFPATTAGATRESSFRTTFRITPIPNIKGTGRLGFRMSSALSVRPSKAGLAVVSRMPAWSIRMVMTRSARELLNQFGGHMNSCEELQRRVTSSARSPFYNHLRRRLAGDEGPRRPPELPSKRPSQRRDGASTSDWPSRSTTASDEDEHSSDGMSSQGGAQGVIAWAQLSLEIPLDWASYQD